MTTISCIVKRPFFLKKKTVKSGETVELPLPLAIELRAANKVEFLAPETVEIEIETVDDPQPGLTAAEVPGGASRGRPKRKST